MQEICCRIRKTLAQRKNDPRAGGTAGGLAQGGTSSMDVSNVALKALLAHIAAGLAAEHVQQTKAANASKKAVASGQGGGGQ